MTSFLYIFTDSLLSFFFLICQPLAGGRQNGLEPLWVYDVIFRKGGFVLFCNTPLPGYSPYGQNGLEPLWVYDVIFSKGGFVLFCNIFYK